MTSNTKNVFSLLFRSVVLSCLILGLNIQNAKSQNTIYQPPASPRATYNFNSGWKFAFGDTTGADLPEFNDKAWARVSLPHTWNETDTYRAYISHGG